MITISSCTNNNPGTLVHATGGTKAASPTDPMASAGQLLEFWFGDDVFTKFPLQKTRYWFDAWELSFTPDEQSKHLAYIEQHFALLFQCAARGELREWQSAAQSSLALTLLLDRLAPRLASNRTVLRNCNRLAVDCCRVGIDAGFLEELTVIERCFYIAPLTQSRRSAYRRMALDMLESFLTELSDTDSLEHEHRGLVQLHLLQAVRRGTEVRCASSTTLVNCEALFSA